MTGYEFIVGLYADVDAFCISAGWPMHADLRARWEALATEAKALESAGGNEPQNLQLELPL